MSSSAVAAASMVMVWNFEVINVPLRFCMVRIREIPLTDMALSSIPELNLVLLSHNHLLVMLHLLDTLVSNPVHPLNHL